MGTALFSCTPDKYEVYDLSKYRGEVDSILLIPNSQILYADGISELNIDIKLFKTIQTWKKEKITLPDGSFGTIDSLYTEVFAVKKTRLNEEVEFLKEDGTKLPEFAKISTTEVEDFKVYVKIGDVQSQMMEIDVREPFPAKEKKVIPVIFHVLESTGLDMPEVNSEHFQRELDKVNAAFSQRILKISNGALANVEFKLALYAPDGTMLEEPGINRKSTNLQDAGVKPLLVENTWDLKKYLNIYVCSYAQPYTYPFTSTLRPYAVLPGIDLIDGLTITTEVETVEELDLSEPLNSGIIIGANNYGGDYWWQINSYNFKRAFAEYLGLLDARYEDYCEDTYQTGWGNTDFIYYYYISRDGYISRPTNVMAWVAHNNTVTGEQVERIHWVLENCPTHWAWKSDFAFTGVE